MGSSVIVGYRYALGAHLALCHGPVDVIREIRVDDRTAWSLADGTVSGSGDGVGAVTTLLANATAAAFPAGEQGSTAALNIYGANGIPGLSLGQAL
ncbi:hypothetical protein MB818_21740, partial [Ruegeria sp. 1NDH52C]